MSIKDEELVGACVTLWRRNSGFMYSRMEDELKTMTNFADRRRERILKALAMAHDLKHNAELFQGVGAHHRKDKNPQAVAAAKSLINQGIKVRLYLDRTMGIMYAWLDDSEGLCLAMARERQLQ